jgi:hypothetical protein
MKQCVYCGREIPNGLKFCSKECAVQYKEKRDKKFNDACPESAKLLKEEAVSIEESDKNGVDLNEIYNFLDLNDAKDGRLNIKAEIMKKVIRLTSKWKSGDKNEWINLLANRTCVSTRKIREDYVQPLISEGILRETEQGLIQFAGLPRKGEVSP